jgi:hypothetical protein
MTPDAPTSPELWELAISAMRDQGIGELTARKFIGLCLKVWPEDTVRVAVTAALGKADFKSYCHACLNKNPKRRPVPSPQLSLLAEETDPARAKADYLANRDKVWSALKR